jgi:uncharacterized protein (TIGR00661 family)
MARIVYSLSGEGRGHATRVATVVNMLAGRHEVLVYTPPTVQALLEKSLMHLPGVTIRPLPALGFQYFRKRLSYVLSLAKSLPYLARLPRSLRSMERQVRDWRATHALVDFEPLLPRVAHKLGLPVISLDHQHFLTYLDTKCLPIALTWRVACLRPSIPLFCPAADHRIVSSYFPYPIRSGLPPMTPVGPLIRETILGTPPECGEHLVAYFRREPSERILSVLSRCHRSVHLYGLGIRQPVGSLRYLPASVEGFLSDLRTCAALICSSGNQLVGEAIAWNKPVLAIPEPGNFEQQLNGFFLPQTGMGTTVQACDFDVRSLDGFLERVPTRRAVSADRPFAGNSVVKSTLSSILSPVEPEQVEENDLPSLPRYRTKLASV